MYNMNDAALKPFERKYSLELIFDFGVVALAIITLLNQLFHFIPEEIGWIVALVTVALGLVPVLRAALRELFHGIVTIDLLASVALLATLYTAEYVSASFIVLMLAFARVFEAITEDRARHAVLALLKLRPETARRKNGDEIEEISVHEVRIGDELIIETGDRAPVDGIVVSGEAMLDESSLTGESMGVEKKKGDKIWSGTLNETGVVIVRTEKIGGDTMLSKMVDLVDVATKEKPKTTRIADRFATFFIIVMALVAVVVYLVTHDSKAVLALLLVTCADDIAVAVPLGFSLAISVAAKRGILLKGSAAFERLEKVKVLALDKTGTLTKGKQKVSSLDIARGISEGEMIQALSVVSSESSHPSSVAIRKYLHEKGMSPKVSSEFNEVPGRGVTALFEGKKFYAGKIDFLKEHKVNVPEELILRIKGMSDIGMSSVVVAEGERAIAVVFLEDELRPHIKEMLVKIREFGVRHIIMLTGDNEKVAKRVAQTLGIDEYVATLRPEDKLSRIKALRKHHGAIAMVGDGVNDAAALALADVSFAMGAIGSETAIEAADIALMHDNIDRLPEVFALARRSMSIIRMNFVIWGITNVVGMILVFSHTIGPEGAALYNFITDFIPIINVFRIIRYK